MTMEDETGPRQPPPQSNDEARAPSDGSVEIIYLLDQLEEMVGVSKRVPFSTKVMVEEDQFLDLVEQLRIAIPNEVRQAQRVVRDRERIISEAQQEAARIVDASRSRAEYLVSENGVYKEALQRSEDVLIQLEERRKREMGEIDVYAMEQFNRVEEALRRSLTIMEQAVDDTAEQLQEARNTIGR